MDDQPRVSSAARFGVLAVLTLIATGLVLTVTPRGQDLTSVWVFLAHLVPFVLAVESVAALCPQWLRRGRLREVAVILVFLGFWLYLVPSLFAQFNLQDFDRFYHWLMITTPYVIIAMSLALRLGGASPATVRRFGYAALLLMVSGLEDLFYQIVNGLPIPERWDWAQHMIVRLGGHVPSKYEAYAFIAVHVVLAIIVLTLPWRRRGGPHEEVPSTGSATAKVTTAAGR